MSEEQNISQAWGKEIMRQQSAEPGWLNQKRIKQYLSQQCIGYQSVGNAICAASVTECLVIFDDGTQGTVWEIHPTEDVWPAPPNYFTRRPHIDASLPIE